MGSSAKLAGHVSTKVTPQSEPIPGKPMIKNDAGGFGFAVDAWTRLRRFLILGSDGGSYYVGERKLTQENAACVRECATADADRTAIMIREVSMEGRAPKNDPAIFALALMVSMGSNARRAALAILNDVCRIGTHIMDFTATVKALGPGIGSRSVQNALQRWYLSKPIDSLAHQLGKYQSRNGVAHRDILRLCRPTPTSPEQDAALGWSIGDTKRQWDRSKLPSFLQAFEEAKRAENAKQIVKLIADHNLPRECIPTQFLNDATVWDALLQKMPMTAMLRNLGKMTEVGLIKPLSKASKLIVGKLQDAKAYGKPPVHPVQFLISGRQYAQGRGLKGSLTWNPDQTIVAALDEAFYLAFGAVEPTGKRHLIALDVSGSMTSQIAGLPISSCEAGACLAMLAMRTEPQTYTFGFATQFRPLNITAKSTLKQAANAAQIANFGGTDAAVPMMHALQHRLEVDVFLCITDNDSWAGRIHPSQALQEYRNKMKIPAKLITLSTCANRSSIIDPTDPGCLDVVGFDSSAPQVMADFARG